MELRKSEEHIDETGAAGRGQDAVRVGVYVCHCGGNISDVVDPEKVVSAAQCGGCVHVARHYPFMCSDPGQKLVVEDIEKNGVNRVVVSACSPTLHELTFRKALERAGLNPYLYEHVNIREQCSWVHKKNRGPATEKAIRLTMAGVGKISRQDPLEPIRVNAERHAVVIGGGVAGMRASLALAHRGIGVTLVERSSDLGGRAADLPNIYPTGARGIDLTLSLDKEVRREACIRVKTGTRVEEIEGYVGNFIVRIRAGGEAESVKAGVIVMATGFDHYQPHAGELGYGESSAVMTLPTFAKLVDGSRVGAPSHGVDNPARSSKELIVDGRVIRSVAFVHCVGSRQTTSPDPAKPPNEYCSRVCCTTAMQTIHRALDVYPDLQIYDLYRDIRTYGRGHEDYYEKAARRGVLFFRFTEDNPVQVSGDNETGGAKLTMVDTLTWGEEVTISADLVVLVTGMAARDISDLIGMLKLPVGSDGFLQEVHPKLRPVELANNGIFVAGACQGPMDIQETCTAAEAAASKAAILLSKPTIQLDPFVARVDEARCNGCAVCLDDCSYSGALAIEEVDGRKSVRVNAALCSGCGACAAVCPERAIDIAGWAIDQFDAMVDAISEDAMVTC